MTTEQLQVISKDPAPRQPSLGKPRLSPSLSGHFRAAKMTTTCPPATLPATLPASPPIARQLSQLLPPALPLLPPALPLLPPALPVPPVSPSSSRFSQLSPENFGIATRISKAHLRCAGLARSLLKHSRGNCGVFGDFCRPAALWSSERASHEPQKFNPIQPES